LYKGERFNSISHLVGGAAALIGGALLVVLAAQKGDPWKIVSLGIYGVTLVLMYVSSTLYHSLRGKAKTVFRTLDHNAIYLLIAGTYTPFTLITLRSGWGWPIFGVIWGLAVLGILVETLRRKGTRILPVIIYLFMGWLVVMAIEPLWRALPMVGFMLLLLGGLFYTVGTVFFAFGKKVRHFHAVWHLFVLAGSVSHYFVMLFYVL
jgi:hemolysin III